MPQGNDIDASAQDPECLIERVCKAQVHRPAEDLL
jgi:hypothetical protein